MRKNWVTGVLGIAAVAAIGFLGSGCGNDTQTASGSASTEKVVKMGVTQGLHAEIMEEVKKEAAKQGINLEIVEFSDFVTPDVALDNGEIDMNSIQHQPFLDNMVKKKGLKLKSIGKTLVAPMAVYSHKVKSLKELPQGAKIAIPNDPSNGARALLLLDKAGIIRTRAGVEFPAVTDITANPKNFQIIELDAAQRPRSLDDVDLAAINTNYALEAGLNPVKDSLFIEDKNSPFAAVIAVREKDANNPLYKKIVKIYQSAPIKKFMENKYKGSVIPAF